MEKYEVFLHNVPKVSEDGKKSLPIDPHRTEEFKALEDAQKSAAGHKGEFDRVVVMHTADDKQKMIERYIDGEHVVPEPKNDDSAGNGDGDGASA